MNLPELLRKGLGYLLMSMGVSSPEKTRPAPQAAPKAGPKAAPKSESGS
jgi:hypothetical protein